jgi:hypothetical protein
LNGGQRLIPIGQRMNLEAFTSEIFGEHRAERRVVVDNENSHAMYLFAAAGC